MNKNRKIYLSKIYLLGAILAVLLFWFTGRTTYIHMTLDYAYDPTGTAIVTVYGEEGELAQGKVEEGRAEIYYWGTEFSGFSPIHYRSYEEISLQRLQLRVHGVLAADLQGKELLEVFEPNEAFRYVTSGEKTICIYTEEEDARFTASEEFSRKITGMAKMLSLWNLVAYLGIWSFLYWYLFRVLDLRKDRSYENLLDAVLGIVGVAAMLISWNIAFTSAYGVTVHPDEMQTKAAIDYYRTHWIQPDVRSELVAGTVSGYGMTRLSEINLYYLFAGKLANFCGFEMSFRCLGMLMILLLTCFVLRNIKKERKLAMLFFTTPQLWYLFSYATSDAYDYLFTVLAAYEVLCTESLLNRFLKCPFSKKQIPGYLGIGFVFANLLMAKKTFYLVLATCFVLLLYRLIFVQREERRHLFMKYAGILAISLGIVLIRYLPDLGYYGLEKSAAVAQVIEETALPEYKPSTPAIEQAKSTLLYEKGVTLREFFTDWHFNRELFKNYFGYYGIYSLEAKEWYYLAMGMLYLLLFGTVGILNHKRMKKDQAEGKSIVRVRLTYWSMWAMIFLMYLLTIYNAYFVDFQPQGRYLFPALPALACQMGLYQEVEEHKAVRTLLVMIAVLSLYSFYKIAYLNF